MADRPVVKSRRITREELARFLPSHRAIKAFEDLIDDVAEALPDAIEGDTNDIDIAQGSTAALAVEVLAQVERLRTLLEPLALRPVLEPLLPQEDHHALLQALREEFFALRQRVEALENKP
jgi:hypothetical protein